jgi:uncharacterized protein YehS (DUF1456 family)
VSYTFDMKHLARQFVLSFAGLSLAASLCAQDKPAAIQVAPPTKATPAPKGKITGHVYCADTHRAARGAMVILMAVPSEDSKQNNNISTMSRVGLDGTYTLGRVPAGEYGVIAVMPGYLSPMDEMNSADMTSQIGPSAARLRELMGRNGTVVVHGDEAETLDVNLERGASLSGQVLYSDGAPATQVTIELEDPNAKAAKAVIPGMNIDPGMMVRGLLMHQNQSTDDRGRFRLAGLKPGTYRIAAVEPRQDNPFQGGDDDGGVGAMFGFGSDPKATRFFAGNTLHRKDAKVYELKAGEELSGVDITLSLDIFRQVRGSVTAKDGRVINRATLTLTDASDDSLVFHAKADDEGAFVFSQVPAGTYTLAATNAAIFVMRDGLDSNVPMNQFSSKMTNAFADGNIAIIVKDGDVADASLTLNEVALPPNANPPEGNTPVMLEQQ